MCRWSLEKGKHHHHLWRLRRVFTRRMIFMLGLDAFIGVCQVESRMKEWGGQLK